METGSIYPEITPFENVSEKYNKNLSDARIKEIQGKRNELERNLKYYKKILKRWKKIGNVLKITIPLVFAILAAIGGTEGIISEAIVLGVVKKKVVKFKKKIE